MNRGTLRLLLALIAGIAATSASPQGSTRHQDVTTIQIDAAIIRQDPRLGKLVSLSARSMPLRAVLDTMAAETGISITMDDLDPASGYVVFASYEKVPVGTIMNGLYGLFSIKRGEWGWTRQGKPGAYTYGFRETSWAKNRRDIYYGLLKGIMENYLTVLRDLTPMKMADRKLHLGELQKALMLDEPGDLQAFFNNELYWNEAKFFFGAVSQDQQFAVLAGTSVPIELKTLPPEVYDLYHQYYLTHTPTFTAPGAAPVKVPEPETLRFYLSNAGSTSAQLAPAIFLASAHGGATWMGTGFLQFGILHAIRRAWTLPGDGASDPASRRVVAEAKDTDEIRKEKSDAVAEANRAINHSGYPEEMRSRISASMEDGLTLGLRLQQLSAGGSTPVLAVVAPTDHSMFKSPVGKPMQDFLDNLEAKGYKRRFYKWRGGVLLVTHPYWFTESTPAIPFAQLRALHPNSAGDLSLTEWTKLMRSITDNQSAWFGVTYNINDMNRLRQCLLVVANEAGILRSDGVSSDNDAVHTLQSVSLVPASLQTLGAGVRVRIIPLSMGAPALAKKALQVEIFDPTKSEWRRSCTVDLPVLQASWMVTNR